MLNANKPEKEKSKAITESEVQKNKEEKKVEEIFLLHFSGHFILTLILKKAETEVEVKVEAVVEEISLANYGDFDFVWQGAPFLI